METQDARARILAAALTLFRERGFDETTMREIAARAKVATGLTYHYFDSKNGIVLAFYQQARHDLSPLLEPAHQEKTLAGRLSSLIERKFKYFEPNRRFLGALMGHAADPEHPLSPFSRTSEDVRAFDIAQFERAIAETRTSVPADLAPHLAKMLWFYQMGLLLFWIYDRSPEQRRTQQLLAASVGVVTTLIKMSNLPLIRPARSKVLKIIEILES